MTRKLEVNKSLTIPPFDRRFYESDQVASRIGEGALGGKASGLVFANDVVSGLFPSGEHQGMKVSVPRFVVIGSDVFDSFMERNNLYEIALTDTPDDRIANAFQKAEFPAEFAGDLRALINTVHEPLAVRSSSILEDAMYEPFAGVYETKMTPNNQSDPNVRFTRIVEAVKFVYASTFFREAKAYMNMTGKSATDEKMSVIIQQVVGMRFEDRFYPTISGVARSYNFYSFGRATPEQGTVDLALGLGKTIVDGAKCWNYSPAYPKIGPPFTTGELLKNTQTEFWAVNMGKPPAYDPTGETEYLVCGSLKEAEYDGSLASVASTYQAQNDRIVPGTGPDGPRILNFAPVLHFGEVPINEATGRLIRGCSEEMKAAVEMEFAVTIDPLQKSNPHFGLVQVRPMVVSDDEVEISEEQLRSEDNLISSRKALGNGIVNDICDIVYVKPDVFDKSNTRRIAAEIGEINRHLVDVGRKYILIGFGRWGSSDPWLGIPVGWSEVSGCRVMIECTLPEMNVDISQGSHFFHNLTSLRLFYFSIPYTASESINWKRLGQHQMHCETDFVKHVTTGDPVNILVDGRSSRGVITG